MKRIVTLISVFACSGFAFGQNLSIEQNASVIFKAFKEVRPLESELRVDIDMAHSVQEFYIALLRPLWGLDVGYLANANRPNQNSAELVTGILLENMFTGTRAIVDRSLGIDMRAAGEILFRIGSEKVNMAETREQVLDSIHSVIPGVRLTDALLGELNPASNNALTAANLEIRMFVLGAELETNGLRDWIEKLGNYSLQVFDQDKNQIAVATSADFIHPLDAVLRVRDSLLVRGISLLAGDILSIGTLTDSLPTQNLSRLRVEFEGLSDQQPVFVYMGFR